MRYAVDLHIHSALSPCAENEMTPNNILNMAWLKGLDIIAVTDHNSAENLPAVIKCAEKLGILVVPGMEVETSEEVHLICLFPDLHTAFQMQGILYAALPNRENREDIFGEQWILDDKDNPVEKCSRFLVTAANIGIDEIFREVRNLGGVVLPAHVDRESYSILSNLGMVPQDLNIKFLELSARTDSASFLSKNPNMGGFTFIRTSDAHRLGSILERESFLELEELSIQALFQKLTD